MTARWWWLALILGVGLLVLASLPLGLNGDVQYVLGGLRVHEPGDPLRFVDTFTHRPIAYRAVLSGLMDVIGLVGIRPDAMEAFEATLRVAGVAAAMGTGAALWLGLQARIGRWESMAIGAVVAAALAFAPNFDFLQPEWFAALFLALGVAAGVGLRHELVASGLAALLLTLAVAVKLATAPLAICGLLLIGLLDRRRAVLTAGAGIMWGAAWLIAVRATPQEWRWMRDMISLNPHSPLRDGIGLTDAINAFKVLASKLALAPVLIVVPVALVLLGRTMEGRARWLVPLTLLAVMGLAFAPLVVQAQWGLYHIAHLPVIGAGIVGLTSIRWVRTTGRPPWLLILPLGMLGAWAALTLSVPLAWRDANSLGVMVGLVLVGLALPVAALVLRDTHVPPIGEPESVPPQPSARWVVVAAVAGLLALAPALAPPAAWSLDSANTPYTNQGWAARALASRRALEEVRERLPGGTRVLYLAYGDVAYHVGRATECRYPSPLWIQRAAFFGYVRSFQSYRDNLRCIPDGGEPFALLQPGWLRPTRIPTQAEGLINATFDCAGAPEAAGVLLCPRR